MKCFEKVALERVALKREGRGQGIAFKRMT